MVMPTCSSPVTSARPSSDSSPDSVKPPIIYSHACCPSGAFALNRLRRAPDRPFSLSERLPLLRCRQRRKQGIEKAFVHQAQRGGVPRWGIVLIDDRRADPFEKIVRPDDPRRHPVFH